MIMRKIIENKANRKDKNQISDFNKSFWDNIAPEKKMIIAWDMVKEAILFKGENNAGESRLQRSIQNIKRRKG